MRKQTNICCEQWEKGYNSRMDFTDEPNFIISATSTNHRGEVESCYVDTESTPSSAKH